MKKPTGEADQAADAITTPPAETPALEQAAPPAASPITHPSEGGSYLRDPATGHLTKQED